MVVFSLNASVWIGEISECSFDLVSDQILDAAVRVNVRHPHFVAIPIFVVPWQRAGHHDVTDFSWLQAYVG